MVRKIFSLTIFLYIISFISVYGEAPVDSLKNISLNLAKDRLTISYDLILKSGGRVKKVWIEAKSINTGLIPVNTCIGDFGTNVLPGVNKMIVWDFKNDDNNLEGKEISVVVFAEIELNNTQYILPGDTIPIVDYKKYVKK